MKIAFIQPNIQDGNLIPSLGILYLAAISEQNGYKVKIFDERINNNCIEEIIKFKPDIVGITAVTGSVLRGRFVASEIKKEIKPVIVFGGPHPTVMPEEVIAWDEVDFVLIGEAEKTFPELCSFIKNNHREIRIGNCFYKDSNGNIKFTFYQPPLNSTELDKLPIPAFHLLDLVKVFKNIQHGLFKKGYRILPVMASRGCPNSCTFCCRIMGYKIRYRNSIKVVDEIEYLVRRYCLDEIYFEDDNFTNNRDRALEILDEIIKRKLGVHLKFANGLRVDRLDKVLLEKMRQAGCYSLAFGLESGSKKTLALMKKRIDLDKAKETIVLAKSMKFLVGANCIVGYPGETIDDIRESIQFFLSLPLDSAAIVNLIPFPKTEVRKICEEKGYLTQAARDYNQYIFGLTNPNIMIETELLSAADIRREIKRAYRLFYLNPIRLLRIYKDLNIRGIIFGLKAMIKNLLKK